MGLIEIRLGDGTYVCERTEFLSKPLLWAITSSSETEVHELVEARKLLETELAGLAAERATPDDLGLHRYLSRSHADLACPLKRVPTWIGR